jgi:uncharacterized protein (TIRG00374 family)
MPIDDTASSITFRGVLRRGVLLTVTLVVLYLLAPGLISVFGAWHDLSSIAPLWFVAMVAVEGASFALVSAFTKLVLPSASWFGITCAQLAGHAVSTVLPGGAATGGAVEYRMLVRAGARPTAVGSAMAVQGVAFTAAVFTLPVFALPAMVLGAGAPAGLRQTAFLGFAVFAVIAAFGAALIISDGVVFVIARVVAALSRAVRRPVDADHLRAQLFEHRDVVREQLGRRWMAAVAFAVGKWLLEYVTLLLALKAVGASPRPSLVLLAYTASAVLSMIPITPGGLGFVEAGLAGTLIAAGVPGAQVAIATLSYRLVTYWLPLPVGLGAWMLSRRREAGRDDEGEEVTRASAASLDDVGLDVPITR